MMTAIFAALALLLFVLLILGTLATSPLPAKESAARAFNAFNIASFTIGTKASTTINVAVQLKDARGQAIKLIASCFFYLSDNADGSTLTATATTSALAVATNGVLLSVTVTGKIALMLTNSSGQFDLNIIQSASPVTYYPVVVLPDGSINVGGAITF